MPGLAGVEGGPDFGGRGSDSSMPQVGELDAENVSGKNDASFAGGDQNPAIAAVLAVIDKSTGSSDPNFGSDGGYGAEERDRRRAAFFI